MLHHLPSEIWRELNSFFTVEDEVRLAATSTVLLFDLGGPEFLHQCHWEFLALVEYWIEVDRAEQERLDIEAEVRRHLYNGIYDYSSPSYDSD